MKINPVVTIVLPLFLVASGAITWQLVAYGQKRTLEVQAIEIAEIIARQAASARSVYAANVVGKLKQDGYGAHIDYAERPGYVPLPAQFLKLFGKYASAESDGLFRYKPVSKWNLEPTQGLDDDFKRWAWAELERQDRANPAGPIAWQPVWRVEQVGGETTLRYLRADPASGDSCVNCHNEHENSPAVVERRLRDGQQPGKQWQKHQLLGAIEVSIPLEKIVAIAARHTNFTTLVVIGVFSFGMLVIAFFVVRDLLRTQKSAEEMTWRANHDTLTGLASRLAFENRVSELFNRCREDNSVHALLYLDLDQFKVVNDTCGHIAGDELLCEIADTMRRNVRIGDTVARLGGDEFGVLLEGCDVDNALQRAERLRSAIGNLKFTRGSRRFEIGVSIGLVPVDNNSEDLTSLMGLADLAVYTAKDEGRNRIKVYSSEDPQIDLRQEEMEWATRFNRAIDQNRLMLAVQHSTCLAGDEGPSRYSEVLLRMVDDDGQPMPIANFISAAERYHFMPTIDRWVIGKVFEMLASGVLAPPPGGVIAINLSGLSINDADLLDYIKGKFASQPAIKPSQLCFEITETAAIGNFANAQHFIEVLRAFGCRFALDDFGSGLSSFSYLKRLPIDYLKIEGSFIRDMSDDPLDLVVVEAACLIGRRIGVATIAEWVENAETLGRVRALGIDYAQGFGIHRPELIDQDPVDLRLDPVASRA